MQTPTPPRSRSPQPVGSIDLESRPAACPSCGGESIEVRYAPLPGLAEALRKRLDPERPFIAQQCTTCIRTGDEERARAMLQRQCHDALAQLDTLPMYLTAGFSTFEVHGASEDREKLERALQFAQAFVTSWPNVPMISVFAGGCGTGKGHLAWSIVRELAATIGVASRVVVLSDVIRDLREAWNSRDDGPSEAERLRRYRAPDVLVIDEISRHAFFGQPQQHLYDLVAYREVRLKPTILTTNERGADLADVLGPALSSRATGWDGFVDFGESDWRLTRGHRRRTA